MNDGWQALPEIPAAWPVDGRLYIYGTGCMALAAWRWLTAMGRAVAALIEHGAAPRRTLPVLDVEGYERRRAADDAVVVASSWTDRLIPELLGRGWPAVLDFAPIYRLHEALLLDLLEEFVESAAGVPEASAIRGKLAHHALYTLGDLPLALRRCDRAVAAGETDDGLWAVHLDALYLAGQRTEHRRVNQQLFRRAVRSPAAAARPPLEQQREAVVLPPEAARNIGHIADLRYFVMHKRLEPRWTEELVLPAHRASVSNPFLLSLWEPEIRILRYDDQPGLDAILRRHGQPGRQTMWEFDAEGRRRPAEPHLYTAGLQRRWEERGDPAVIAPSAVRALLPDGWRADLEAIGVPVDRWFVCLHVRDTSAEGYHRLRALRNARIGDYRAAVDAVVARGGIVVRIGDPGMEPIGDWTGVVDYAHATGRRDWMDVYLLSHGRLFVGVNSGPYAAAKMFGVPALLTNHTPAWHAPVSAHDRYIPKLYWSDTERRLLPFDELLREPFATTEAPDVLAMAGVRAVDNSPDEVAEAVVEMLDRLDGAGTVVPGDPERQARLRAVFEAHGLPWRSPVGAAFLARHDALLDVAGQGSRSPSLNTLSTG